MEPEKLGRPSTPFLHNNRCDGRTDRHTDHGTVTSLGLLPHSSTGVDVGLTINSNTGEVDLLCKFREHLVMFVQWSTSIKVNISAERIIFRTGA